MRSPMAAALVFALLVFRVSDTHAQAGHDWFGGASVGLLVQDVPSLSYSSSDGASFMAHVGRELGAVASLVGEIAWLSTPRNTSVVFLPVEPDPGFGGGFLGPTGFLTVGAKIRVATAPNTVRGYLTGGPSLAWVARHEAGSRAVAVGGSIGAGAILRAGARTAVVAEATYREFSTDGLTARWMVPITLGIELR
jgi:hypothetical protein